MTATFHRVAWAADPWTAGMIRSELQAAGFHPGPVADSTDGNWDGPEIAYYVEVMDVERRAVIEYLRSHGYARQVFD